ncbi:MAG: GlsB/YeaQ/YmgE family stress response membrane protein [Ignavibacteriales bacterium]|nr:GlsB/YeaQ/YmgE family stress response membrane protein [Ignavibacteriales bacterium]
MALYKIITPKKPKGCFSGVLLGVAGGIVGGFIMKLLGEQGIIDFSFYGLFAFFVATLGAVVLIWLARQFGK